MIRSVDFWQQDEFASSYPNLVGFKMVLDQINHPRVQ